MPDAMARLQALLPELLGAGAGGSDPGSAPEAGGGSLWRVLPDADALAAAGLAPAGPAPSAVPGAVPDTGPNAGPDGTLLSRSMVASTLLAGLELARQGRIALRQSRSFADVCVCRAQDAPPVEQGARLSPGGLAAPTPPPADAAR